MGKTYMVWQFTTVEDIQTCVNALGFKPDSAMLNNKHKDILIDGINVLLVDNIPAGHVYFYPPIARLPRLLEIERRPII